MSEDAIPTEMIKVCINTLNSDFMTPEEQALGYFTRKKLKRLSTWDEWLAGEAKQLNLLRQTRSRIGRGLIVSYLLMLFTN